MEDKLPFFNLSLKKVLALEPNSFKRAKIKIVVVILLFSLIKALVVIPVAIQFAQYHQLLRALLVSLLFLALIKAILYKPSEIAVISHFTLISGLAVIWSNLLIYEHGVNIVSLQVAFMTTLVSFYLVGNVEAMIYTTAAISPLIFYMLTKDSSLWKTVIATEELASPGYTIIIILNFITFIISHYLYNQAFHENLKEKEILNQQLQENVKEAKSLAESRSVFLSTMSHELRTPLNGVIGMTNLLKDTALEEQKENLNILEFSATNLLAMINDILDYNKGELNKIELESLPVNLSVLLQKICYGLQIKAIEKSLKWKLEWDEILKDKTVITDPTRLTQIIFNLAGNAIKFTNQGSVTVSAKVLSWDEDTMHVQFSIRDTGIGIGADRQEAIFDPFIQGSSDTTRKYGGTGLGLAIVKRILKRFDSKIQLESEPGKGSVFSFTLRLEIYKGKPETVNEFRIEKPALNGLKLLLVDDNHINILLLEKMLSKWEIKTESASNGEEALLKFLNDNFDGVLMDIHMPLMDGFETTLAIRSLSDESKAKIPVIAITASVSHDVYEKVNDSGMNDYLPKPFQVDQLYEKLVKIYKSQY